MAADLAARLNYPHCQKPDKNDHYMHFCLTPTVIAARRENRRLLAAAIFTCELKKTTAGAPAAMYSIDAQGRHIDPGKTDGGACENLVGKLIVTRENIKPTRVALIFLLKVGPTKRTYGWFPKTIEYGMHLLGGAAQNCPHLPSPRSQVGHGGKNVGRTVPIGAPGWDGGHALPKEDVKRICE